MDSVGSIKFLDRDNVSVTISIIGNIFCEMSIVK